MDTSRWHFELWSPTGVLLADLAGRAKNRRITQSRNRAEEMVWQVGLDDFETYANAMNVDPNTLVVPGATEVRIRRGSKYICGGQLTYVSPVITDQSQDMELRASGFLTLFGDRFTAARREFTATEATTIYSTLITESQTGTNASFGVTIGSLATVGAHDKTFKSEKLQDAIERGCELFDFDHEFTYDKVFNTYSSIGSRRPEIVFEYPGTIRAIRAPIDATNLKNRIYVLGSGAGDQGNATVQVDDANSQINYKVREERLNFSDVEDLTDLTNHGNSELSAWSYPFQIPGLEVDGNLPPYVTDYGIGDYVNVKCNNYAMLRQINGMYRIEKREILIDENDRETIRLYMSI